jgi:hypothetical protein
MTVHTKYLFFLTGFALIFCTNIFAQEKNKKKPPWKQDTVIADNVFKKYNNWLSAGAGVAKNSHPDYSQQFTGGVDYNFHIQKEYFQFGLFVAGDQFGEYSNYQFHFCYGKRIENNRTNFALFGGLSYTGFYPRLGVNNYAYNSTSTAGLYLNAQLIFKLTYDVGTGVSAFIDVNSFQTITGAKVDLYFSGAFKGKKGAYD